jgi:hypothetical protein
LSPDLCINIACGRLEALIAFQLYHAATCNTSALLQPTQEEAVYHQHPCTTKSENAYLVQHNSSVYLWFVVLPLAIISLTGNIVGSVLLFTGICLAMAGHFQSVLAASDLSAYSLLPPIHTILTDLITARFVPFAIFVCSASLFIFVVL